jgi:hypothetical protein
MEAAGSFKVLAHVYQTALFRISEECNHVSAAHDGLHWQQHSVVLLPRQETICSHNGTKNILVHMTLTAFPLYKAQNINLVFRHSPLLWPVMLFTCSWPFTLMQCKPDVNIHATTIFLACH